MKLFYKVLLFLLALLPSFTNALTVEDLIDVKQSGQISLNGGETKLLRQVSSSDYGVWCIYFTEVTNNGSFDLWYFSQSYANFSNFWIRSWYAQAPSYVCLDINLPYFKIRNSESSSTTITYELFKFDELLSTNLPGMTSLECQTEYNLIPISSVDSNYCTTNNLCPSCPSCPSVPVGTGGYSQLYINNILHLGAPNIIMNIPDEIDWDYAYTQGGQNMNIDVVGYNVDYEKIDSIVQFQNYKPTSEDFQKIIGLLAPYTKIIVFFVFLFIVWAWIKKPFKSKKL